LHPINTIMQRKKHPFKYVLHKLSTLLYIHICVCVCYSNNKILISKDRQWTIYYSFVCADKGIINSTCFLGNQNFLTGFILLWMLKFNIGALSARLVRWCSWSGRQHWFTLTAWAFHLPWATDSTQPVTSSLVGQLIHRTRGEKAIIADFPWQVFRKVTEHVLLNLSLGNCSI